MNFEWIDKQDGFDDVLAEDINKLAHGIINSANKIGLLSQEKADKKEIKADTIPTENSTNLITSGGVYEALQNISSGGGGAENFVISASFSGEIQQGVTERISIDKSYEDLLAAYKNHYNLYVKLNINDGMEFILPLIVFDNDYFWFKWQNVVGDMLSFDIGVTLKRNEVLLKFTPVKTADVEENSNLLITSGGVYTAIGDIESSLENIITKYGLGGETE